MSCWQAFRFNDRCTAETSRINRRIVALGAEPYEHRGRCIDLNEAALAALYNSLCRLRLGILDRRGDKLRQRLSHLLPPGPLVKLRCRRCFRRPCDRRDRPLGFVRVLQQLLTKPSFGKPEWPPSRFKHAPVIEEKIEEDRHA